MIRDELQSSFKQRSEQTIQRKQQELEEQLFKRTIDAVQEVDIDSQRVSTEISHWVLARGREGGSPGAEKGREAGEARTGSGIPKVEGTGRK